MVACTLVGSRLDYANSVLYGTTQENISKLQKTRNLLACVVTNSFQSSSHTLLQHPLDPHRKQPKPTSLSVLYISLSRLTYTLPCMLIILLAPSGCPTQICSTSPLHSSALHSVPAVSVSPALKSRTLYPHISKRTLVQLLPLSSKNSSHLFHLAFQSPQLLPSRASDSSMLEFVRYTNFVIIIIIQPPLTIVRVYTLYLLTYLFIYLL